jgi:hypothetical protein
MWRRSRAGTRITFAPSARVFGAGSGVYNVGLMHSIPYRRSSAIALSFLATVVLTTSAPADTTGPDTSRVSDPRAITVADGVMISLGGKKRWDDLVGLRWTFEVATNDTVRSVRRHSWNKHTGWHRVSGTTRTGTPFVYLHRLDSNEGAAWMGGQAIQGDSLQKLLQRANSLWINDTYWMLMPYKLRDPGVTLKDAGFVREGDYVWDKVALSFDRVGDTPGDRYWVSVNRATRRVERWEMVLEGDAPPPVAWTWEGWEEHDGLWFPTIKRGPDRRVIYTRNVETVRSFPAAEFTTP